MFPDNAYTYFSPPAIFSLNKSICLFKKPKSPCFFSYWHFSHSRSHSRQSGFTLIEILVTLAISSVGLIGLAAMDSFSFRKNNDTYFRSQAVLQAHAMAARMHANPLELAKAKELPYTSAYSNVTGSGVNPPTPNCLDRTSTTKSAADSATSNCSESDIANFDSDEWLYATAAMLPNGAGSVSGPVDGVYTITVAWNEAVSGGESSDKSFAFEFAPLP